MTKRSNSMDRGTLSAAVFTLGVCLGSVAPMSAAAEEHSDPAKTPDASDSTTAQEDGEAEKQTASEEKTDSKRRPRRGGPCAL